MNNLALRLENIEGTEKAVIAVVTTKQIEPGSKLRICKFTEGLRYTIQQEHKLINDEICCSKCMIAEADDALRAIERTCQDYNEAIESGERKGDKIDYQTQQPLIEID